MFRNILLYSDESHMPFIIINPELTTALLLISNLTLLIPQLYYLVFHWNMQNNLLYFLVIYFSTLIGLLLLVVLFRVVNSSSQNEGELPVRLFLPYKLRGVEYGLLTLLLSLHLCFVVYSGTNNFNGNISMHFAIQLLTIRDLVIIVNIMLIILNSNTEDEDYFSKMVNDSSGYKKFSTGERSVAVRLVSWGVMVKNVTGWIDYLLLVIMAHFGIKYSLQGNNINLIYLMLPILGLAVLMIIRNLAK